MFLLDCEARRLTPATREFYRAKLAVFVRWCAEEHIENLNELTAHHIRRFLVHILRRGLSGQYQHNLARAIRAFLNYCVRDDLLETSPFAQVQMPRLERKVPEALSAHEFNTILRSCTCARDRAICLFLLDSGVRASELLALNLGDVDLKTGAVTVRLGKGQKGRTTYVGAATRKQLRRYYAERTTTRDDDPIFIAEKGRGRLTQGGLVQLMERLRIRSGVALCTCHTFRRTFAITCLRNGMNLYVLARLMGHADITVLRPYLALVEDDLQDAHARYGAVDRMLR
jgi:integrase/recombinase XerD